MTDARALDEHTQRVEPVSGRTEGLRIDVQDRAVESGVGGWNIERMAATLTAAAEGVGHRFGG